MKLRPIDDGKMAKAERGRADRLLRDPDFEIDAALVKPGVGSEEAIKVKVEVTATVSNGFEPDGDYAFRNTQSGEPVFVLRVREASLADPGNYQKWRGILPDEPYWIAMPGLTKHGFAEIAVINYGGITDDGWPLFIDRATREAMLIWWDEHGEEVEARVSEEPSDAEVQRHLTRLNFKWHRERSGGADWSVQAWGLGKDVYLTNDENGHFALLHREMDGEDEIEELDDGTLEEMLNAAPEFL